MRTGWCRPPIPLGLLDRARDVYRIASVGNAPSDLVGCRNLPVGERKRFPTIKLRLKR